MRKWCRPAAPVLSPIPPEERPASRGECRPDLSVSAIGPLFGKAEDRQYAAELRVVGQRLVGPDRAEPVGVLGQTRSHADPGPAADTRQDGDVLLAALRVGVDIADDAGGCLEPVELLAGLNV